MDKGYGGGGDGAAYEGEWIMWMDDDAIFCDMRFQFPFERYDADGIDLIMWGDEKMTYVDGDSEGINTGASTQRSCTPTLPHSYTPTQVHTYTRTYSYTLVHSCTRAFLHSTQDGLGGPKLSGLLLIWQAPC